MSSLVVKPVISTGYRWKNSPRNHSVVPLDIENIGSVQLLSRPSFVAACVVRVARVSVTWAVLGRSTGTKSRDDVERKERFKFLKVRNRHHAALPIWRTCQTRPFCVALVNATPLGATLYTFVVSLLHRNMWNAAIYCKVVKLVQANRLTHLGQ